MKESWEKLRNGQAFQGQQYNGGRESGKQACVILKKGRGIYSSQKLTIAVLRGADNPALEQNILPKYLGGEGSG
jgi:hypothetical protein